MDAVLNILGNLGVNITAIYQLGIFTITFIVLYFLVFKPYHEAYEQRIAGTQGNEKESEKLLAESERLQKKLNVKTIEINDDYQKIYDESRKQAQKEYESLVHGAREKAKQILDSTRRQISNEIEKARVELEKQAPAIKEQIVEKMIR